ncbi:DUF6498-containing protein [Haloarcula marina]|uniref:DUF6498-containing protein n=1 Tax=Haloarcula marina TaxID=2961574 RepID=UPI0020B805EA|nr:DUF6498-containing protein [Halomicroarcula marina]
MPSRTRENAATVSFLPTLAANLFPLVGIAVFEWRVAELLAVYWVEIGVALVSYGVAALFARRPVVLDGRQFYLPGVSPEADRAEKWERDPRPLDLPWSLPPMYPRNGRLVFLTLVTGFGFLGFFLAASPGVVESLRSPWLGLAAAGMVLSDWRYLSREFFSENRYEELSAHMVLEIPVRVLFFAVAYVLLLGSIGLLSLVFGIFLLREMGIVVPAFELADLFAATIVLGKVAVERSRFRAETEAEPSGFATWFLPEDPRE